MKDLKLFLFCTAFATLLPSVPARAESLEEEEKWNGQMSYMDSYMKADREACGITDEKKWSFSFDKPSFSKGEGADWGSHSPNGFCSGIFDELAAICRNSESGKKRVLDKIKGVVCKFGQAERRVEKWHHHLHGGLGGDSAVARASPQEASLGPGFRRLVCPR
jgi:hypothetical protein